VKDRIAHGPFRSVEDLVRVPGVGEGLLRSIKDYIETTYVGDGPSEQRAGGRLDLNRAQIKELEQITGIGPALAARITAARAARGRFQGLEELLEIPGIGPKTLQVLREEAYVR
jgi:competence protein ComEA